MEKVDVALAFISPVGFLIKKLMDTSDDVDKQIIAKKKLTIAELEEEARRQEIKMDLLAAEAKAAQEIAIARRIEQAFEVEIEEFYDVSGEGSAGVKTDGQMYSVGLSGSGKRVTRRVFKFNGFTESKDQANSPSPKSTTAVATIKA